MSYEYDIFISYRRNTDTRSWISEHFVRLLKLHVGHELPDEPAVFVDDQIEAGTAWPASLGRALGCSRTLIMLWSGNYLESEWCALELTHMLSREQKAKLRTVERPHGLVIPVVIHGADRYPKKLGYIQYFDIHHCFKVTMARNSILAGELEDALAERAPGIAACIRSAPPWRAAWSDAAATKLLKQYHKQKRAAQKTVPRFSTP